MRFTGATRALGLGPLAPECSSAAFAAVAVPQDRALAEKILKPQEEGTEVAVRLRMRDAETCIWRGVWLEDGLRAAGVVALEKRFSASERDHLTGLLDRRTFIARAAEALTQPGEYELVAADVDRLRRLNEALGHERADLVLAALGSRLNAAFSQDAAAARVGEDEFAIILPRGAVAAAERLREALEQPLRVAGFDIYPTVSIGAGWSWRSSTPSRPGAAAWRPMAGRSRATACPGSPSNPTCATLSCAGRSNPSTSRS
jgi:c-di-GMP-specific phosphodiesterase